MPKETVNQSATKRALLADQTATTSGEEHVASPPKVFKAKEIPKKGQKAAPKLVVNESATKAMLYWLMKQPPHQVRNMLLHLQKYLKQKKYPAKKLHQNWLIIRVSKSMLYWLIKQPPHQVRNMLLHLQKYLKPKKYPKRDKKLHQNW